MTTDVVIQKLKFSGETLTPRSSAALPLEIEDYTTLRLPSHDRRMKIIIHYRIFFFHRRAGLPTCIKKYLASNRELVWLHTRCVEAPSCLIIRQAQLFIDCLVNVASSMS
jgi:hypothetical protein